MYASIASAAGKIEIKAQGLPRETFDCSERRPDTIRGTSLPLRTLLKPIV